MEGQGPLNESQVLTQLSVQSHAPLPLPIDLNDRLRRWTHSTNTAVIEQGAQRTYAEFVERTLQLVALLRTRKVNRVLLCLPQCFDAYTLIWAALLSKTPFCSLSYGTPVARIEFCRDAFKPDLSVGIPESIGGISAEDLTAMLRPVGEEDVPPSREGDHVAYVLFTSGSTGHPKGVTIPRSSLDHVIAWAIQEYRADSTDVWAQYSSLGFDLSLLDIFTAISCGAALLAVSTPGEKMLPSELIKNHSVTIWHSVPSAFELIDRSRRLNTVHLKSLRLVIFCGERLFPSLAQKILALDSKPSVYNTYGPTEATILCSYLKLTASNIDDNSRATVSIGEPLPGNTFTLADPANGYGELVISGLNVGLGYIDNDRELGYKYRDGEAQPCEYRTGDYCRYVDGALYFEHRKDSQIKILGNRIDLSEIDQALRDIGCSSSLSIEFNGKIVSFVLNSPMTEDALRDSLRKQLPEYYLPSEIVCKLEFPYTLSGKIDVNELKGDYAKRAMGL